MADKTEIHLYKSQIRCLEETIKKCQLKNEELKKENKKLSCQNEMLKEDREDISEYLHHCIVAKEKEEQELLLQLKQNQLDRQKEEEAMKLRLSNKKQQIQEQVEQIQSNAEKLAQLKDEILQMKEQMKEQLEPMKEKLKTEAENHKTAMENLQLESHSQIIKKLQETHDIIDREMSAREQEKRSQAKQQAEEIQSLNEQMSRIAVERETLTNRKNKLHKEIDKKRTILAELTGNIFQLQKELKELENKCEAREARLNDDKTNLQKSLATEEALREELATMSERLQQEMHKSEQQDVELRREKSMISELRKIMRQTARVLRATIKDSQKREEAQTNLQKLLTFLEEFQSRGALLTLDDAEEKQPMAEIEDPQP